MSWSIPKVKILNYKKGWYLLLNIVKLLLPKKIRLRRFLLRILLSIVEWDEFIKYIDNFYYCDAEDKDADDFLNDMYERINDGCKLYIQKKYNIK